MDMKQWQRMETRTSCEGKTWTFAVVLSEGSLNKTESNDADQQGFDF